MPKPLYTISAKGEFVINLIDRRRCGNLGNRFRFDVAITTEGLDAHGFVFNGDEVPAAFARFSHGLWEASCEDIAGGIIYVFKKICAGRATRIAVTIHPSDVRNLTCEWQRGWDMPERFPMQVDTTGNPIPKAKVAAPRRRALVAR